MEQTGIVVRPVISEKSMDAAGHGQFTFVVATTATKPQVKQAIEEQFKVNVVSVRTFIMKGKRGKAGKRRVAISLSPFKKAIVGLAEGQRIDIFEVQKEGEAKRE